MSLCHQEYGDSSSSGSGGCGSGGGGSNEDNWAGVTSMEAAVMLTAEARARAWQ